MEGIDFGSHPNLLVGLAHPDDAGVYRLTDDIALVQTVDFFTPIVDDPFLFGQIAAANALSDVYAMGATPITAMNIVTFPQGDMPLRVLTEILKGGLDKANEADCPIVGGHTVKAPELKYGLSVTGRVHPDRVWTNTGARAGDRLVLTKPLGTGIVSTAVKGNAAHKETADAAAEAMATLNRDAAEAAEGLDVHACTDVTGFGLVGHLTEMLAGAEVGAVLMGDALPSFPRVDTYAEMGLLPGGLSRNRNHFGCRLTVAGGIPQFIADLVCDPQTSGGLLFAVDEATAAALVTRLEARGISPAVIGEIVDDDRERILVK